jgi:glycosyltransferase involved in cell wall biosynthesis
VSQLVPALTVIVLTHNEEQNLPACLESIRELDAEVVVVDSGSTDRTLAIAGEAGCRVVEHPFENHAAQLNWALERLPVTTPWVMRLDADERLSPELVRELSGRLSDLPEEVTGLLVKRRVYFWGRWIRHGGYYPTWLLRIWRHGRARCEQRWMDEHMIVDRGRTLRLDHDIVDENRKGLTFWTDKHNRYADREVRDLLASQDRSAKLVELRDQAGLRRWLKQNLYGRAPLFWRACGYWFYRYVLRLGFLDGRPGLVFHFLQGFWYRFLVDAKIWELTHRAPGGSQTEPGPGPQPGPQRDAPALRSR